MEKRYESPKYNLGKIAAAAIAGLAVLVLFTGYAPKRDSWDWARQSGIKEAGRALKVSNGIDNLDLLRNDREE